MLRLVTLWSEPDQRSVCIWVPYLSILWIKVCKTSTKYEYTFSIWKSTFNKLNEFTVVLGYKKCHINPQIMWIYSWGIIFWYLILLKEIYESRKQVPIMGHKNPIKIFKKRNKPSRTMYVTKDIIMYVILLYQKFAYGTT